MKVPISEDQITLALLKQDLTYIKIELAEIKTRLDNNYVSKAEFEPIKKIVYGVVTIILVAVVGALVALVIKQ